MVKVTTNLMILKFGGQINKNPLQSLYMTGEGLKEDIMYTSVRWIPEARPLRFGADRAEPLRACHLQYRSHREGFSRS
jgi:hypothetical protein